MPCPSQSKLPRRILLIEDHPLVRTGLIGLIQREDDLEVFTTAGNAASILQEWEASRPDLVVLGTVLGECSELDLLRNIKRSFPQAPVLFWSTEDERVFAPRALRSGASGYLMKDALASTVLTAIRTLLAGKIYVSDVLKKKMSAIAGNRTGLLDPLQLLTSRERQVFRLIGQGKAYRAIACELGISLKTVETHRSHIKAKLNLHSLAELIQSATSLEYDEVVQSGQR